MKTVILKLILACTCHSALAQTFAPVGSTWYYSNIESFFSPHQGYEKMESIGDTTIQGKAFRRIGRTYFFSTGNSANLSDEFLHLSGDTVFRLADDGHLYVLYNFGAQPGNTWITKTYDLYAGHDREITVTVDSISTTTINGQQLRELFVNTNDGMSFGYMGQNISGKITEKLGGWLYMYPQDYGFWDSDIRSGLRCYSDNQLGDYNSGISPSCSHRITNREDGLAPASLKLYPNPTKSAFNIDLAMYPGNKNIRVYNSVGMLVHQQTLSGNETKARITLNTSGIYVVLVSVDNLFAISERLVVE